MFKIYAIYNKNANKYYIGQSINLAERIKQHNEHTFKGYTAGFPGEWELIYEESVATRPEALKREKQLKSGNGRIFIKSIIPE
ncbi:GIY-YIG nuclease family protein [Candidatus Saccharibacteria bacterium]|nr:GIY-YIG nuclease family protein [Candidatus Saccharibacteria bacterium]